MVSTGTEVERCGVQLIISSTHSFDPNIEFLTEIIAGRKLGALSIINTWNCNDVLFRPRLPEELDTSSSTWVQELKG